MPRHPLGPLIILFGAVLVFLGLLVWSGALSWFGRLPGDIRIERPNVRIYFPITSLVILSVVFSIVAAIVRRFR